MLKDKKILKELEEIYPDTLIADGLDEALIGITERKGHTIAVYEKSDGKTYVGTMNAGLLGKMFGGSVAEVMGVVDVDQQSFIDFTE